MIHWLKLRGNGGYINLNLVTRLEPTFISSGDYGIQVATGVYLEGSYASAGDAEEAARRICQGIDPSTLV